LIKVIYIAGFGRSGSTLLGNILGSLHGFIHVGELRYLWDRGFLEDWDCGCGKSFSQCSFWQKVIKDINFPHVIAPHLVNVRERGIHSRHLLYPFTVRKLMMNKMNEYLYWLKLLYQSISEHTGCEWIVDSSKFPSHGYLLDNITNINLYILHLVRDPRTVSYAWWKRTKNLGLKSNRNIMPRFNPIKSATLWLEWNYIIHHTWSYNKNYIFLRYEDFVMQPRSSIFKILAHLGLPKEYCDTIFINENTVKIATQHTISGNPVRFQKGVISVLSSYQDMENLGLGWRSIVSLITLPLLKKFHYALQS